MNKLNISLLAALISAGLSANVTAADSLVTFSANTPARADEVNSNFAYLESKINAISSTSELTQAIDCGANPDQLKTTLENARFAGQLTLNVTGTCDGPINIYKDDVTIIGGEIKGADIDGELEAINVSGRTNIILNGVTINSGVVTIFRESFVRFDNVVLPTPKIEDIEDGWYFPNVDMRSSTLRINSGSLENLSLASSFNSYVRINKDVTGSPQQISIDLNSSVHSKVPELTVNGILSLFGNGSFIGKKVSSGSLEIGNSSSFEVREFSSTGFVSLNEGGLITIEGEEGVAVPFTAKAMECHAADIYIDGGMSLTGTDEEAGGNSFEAHHGCRGEINGKVTFQDTPDDWSKANYSHVSLSYINSNNEFKYIGEAAK